MLIKKIFFLILFSWSLNSIGATVSKIDIIGLNTISRGTVLSYLPLEVGDNFDVTTVQNIQKSLQNTDFFQSFDINFDAENGTLEIKISENPTIKYIEFNNYSDGEVLDDSIIENIRKNSGLDVGNIFIDSKLEKIRNELKNLYKSKGFYQFSSNVNYDKDANNRIGVEIVINEGERSRIEQFTIAGSKYFNQEEIWL